LAVTLHLPAFFNRLLGGLVVGLVPVILVLGSARLLTTEWWLRFEYTRPGFPEDRYGWDPDIRLTYGPYGIRYLVSNKDRSYLAELEIEGEPACLQEPRT